MVNQPDNLPIDRDSRKVNGDLKNLVSYCQKYYGPIKFLDSWFNCVCKQNWWISVTFLHGAFLMVNHSNLKV